MPLLRLFAAPELLEYMQETAEGDTAVCRIKRNGQPEEVRTFSQADAKAAGLAGKSGPWSQYPARMRQMRARAFALRDVFADVLKGLAVAEELQDIQAEQPKPAPRHMGDIQRVDAPAEPPEALRIAAEEAALRGVDAYRAHWAGLSGADRRALAGLHSDLKRAAEESDASRLPTTVAEQIDADTGEGVDVIAGLIHHTDPQGSDAWMQARRGVITGSRFRDARTASVTARCRPQPWATRRTWRASGAAACCCRRSPRRPCASAPSRSRRRVWPTSCRPGLVVEECGFFATDDGLFGVSPDGLVGDDGLIEIKTMCSSATLFRAVVDGDISDYRDQIVGELWLLHRDWCDLSCGLRTLATAVRWSSGASAETKKRSTRWQLTWSPRRHRRAAGGGAAQRHQRDGVLK